MQKQRLLLLIANRANRELLAQCLSRDYQVLAAAGDNVLDVPFDLAIVDAKALVTFKNEVQQRREAEAPVFLPFLVCLPRTSAAEVARFLRSKSVDDLILTPIEVTELKARVGNLLELRRLSLELESRFAEVQRMSLTDDVSGFHNTRFLHQHLDELLARPGTVVSVVFTDMDRFKSVVDTHGHLLGAKVLREAAEVFHQHLEPSDRIVRYGGDEYVIIMPGVGKVEAAQRTERVRQGLADASFLQEEGIGLRVTASIGLATYPDDATDKRELLAAADTCLFRSKERGKNCITVYGE